MMERCKSMAAADEQVRRKLNYERYTAIKIVMKSIDMLTAIVGSDLDKQIQVTDIAMTLREAITIVKGIGNDLTT